MRVLVINKGDSILRSILGVFSTGLRAPLVKTPNIKLTKEPVAYVIIRSQPP